MPDDSALVRALKRTHGQEGWTTTEELLASLIEIVDYTHRNLLLAQGINRQHLPSSVQVPRPYARAPLPEAKSRELSTDELVEILKRQRN